MFSVGGPASPVPRMTNGWAMADFVSSLCGGAGAAAGAAACPVPKMTMCMVREDCVVSRDGLAAAAASILGTASAAPRPVTGLAAEAAAALPTPLMTAFPSAFVAASNVVSSAAALTSTLLCRFRAFHCGVDLSPSLVRGDTSARN